MSDNVIGLFGDGGGGDGEPDERIVEVLENALERAKAGEVADLLIVYRFGPDSYPMTEKAWTAESYETLGGIHFAASAALREMEVMFSNSGEHS